MEPPAGGDDAGEEGMPDFSVAGPVACHLGASCVLEDAGGLRITASFLYSMNHELIERLSWCI